jgi:hypothetical protein
MSRLGIPGAALLLVYIPSRHVALLKGKINSTYAFLLLNPLNAELNPICYLLALLGAHYFLHVSRIRVKLFLFG